MYEHNIQISIDLSKYFWCIKFYKNSYITSIFKNSTTNWYLNVT